MPCRWHRTEAASNGGSERGSIDRVEAAQPSSLRLARQSDKALRVRACRSTFDITGGQRAKPVGRPVDGRVRRQAGHLWLEVGHGQTVLLCLWAALRNAPDAVTREVYCPAGHAAMVEARARRFNGYVREAPLSQGREMKSWRCT
jgi:hypothetical protein